MTYIQLYAKQQNATGPDYAQYIELDLFPQDPIKVTKNVQQTTDATATVSNFSRTFQLPNTSKNNQYFKAVFNVNSLDYDATQKADAYINVDGANFMSGNIRLESIARNDKENRIEYRVVFMGETSTFGSIVNPKYLTDLDFTRYAHTSTYSNVVNSWSYNLFNGDIIYPLCEWGYTYDSVPKPTLPTLSRYDAVTSQKGFTDSANGLSVGQFKPMIRAKAVWDQIFEEAGFTYTSDFLSNNQLFTNLYMISSNQAQATLTASQGFRAFGNSVALLSSSIGTVQKMQFSTEAFDDSNSWDAATSTFTAGFTANPFKFTVAGAFDAYIKAGQFFNIQWRLYVNGTPTLVANAYTLPAPFATDQLWSSPLISHTFSLPLNQGDTVEFYVAYSPAVSASFVDIQFGRVEGVNPQITTPNNLLPAQYKQIDFIKGINNIFKLIWEPDPANPKNFIITPWINWINQGTKRDWSDKLDESKDLTIEPLFYTQPRQLTYKDSNEGDLYNFDYEQTYKQIFGQLNADSGIELLTGNKEITSIFAPVPLAPIGNYDEFLIPHFAKDTEAKREPIQVKPRLVYYNGLVNAPLTWYFSNGSTSVAQTQYPLVSQFDQYPFDSTAFNLNWFNSPQFWDPAVLGFDGRTGNTAFDIFWRSWYEGTYSPYGRVLKAKFKLDIVDFKDIRFNDLIYIKDAWWQPVKIKDYPLGADALVEVELIKMPNIGINYEGDSPSGTPSYQWTFCYSSTAEVDACCCSPKNEVTIYTEFTPLSSNVSFWLDSNRTVPASAGYYSDGTTSYLINTYGQITLIGLCPSCGPGSLTSYSVCTSVDFCKVCCCDSYLNTIYGDNSTTLSLSSKAYSGATGGTLTPGSWYRASGDSPILIGSDGNTIVQVGDCSICDCDELVDVRGVSIYQTDSDIAVSDTIDAVCCIEGITGANINNLGVNSVYTDTSAINTATEFYFDSGKTFPVGVTGNTFVSDGEYYVGVTGGTGGGANLCPGATCPNRTETVKFNHTNPTITNVEIQTNYGISFDGLNFFYNGSDTETGNSFNVDNLPAYSPTSYFKGDFIIAAGYTGLGKVTIYKGGSNYAGPFSFTGPGTFTWTSPETVGTGNNWEAFFVWTP